MLTASLVVAALVLAGPPGGVEVQRPGQGTKPARNEGAEPMPSDAVEPEQAAAPEVGTGAEPGPETEAEPEPEPAPTGGITPLGSAPAEPEPAPEGPSAGEGGAITSWRDAAPVDPEYERPGYRDDIYAPPSYRGTGFFITGGLAFGTVVLKQALSPIFCDGNANINCDSVGWIDRSFAAGAIGLIGGGGWMRGKWAATDGGKHHPADAVRKRKIAGWTLAGIGFAGAAVDMSLAIACWGTGDGPYAIDDPSSPFITKCRSTVTALTMDGATMLASTGMGLGLWANAYERSRPKAQARLTGVAPLLGPGRVGVGVSGSF